MKLVERMRKDGRGSMFEKLEEGNNENGERMRKDDRGSMFETITFGLFGIPCSSS